MNENAEVFVPHLDKISLPKTKLTEARFYYNSPRFVGLSKRENVKLHINYFTHFLS